ncbi:NUDIX hydrolase [Sporosarcina trichiuri]|uniref:NUDIX hydrolase n=1 Tax=Sporosarcina trichiuri TaxID=3056445 RepID=UPI0025B603DF|nr:NUDIX domain-containing protein [Sporosarcina sp. 0.2-SM1T-5]WJY27512.1 NUDIX domain-containing protein [Sporosarcina sp. 0.2-SM1T-5]
MTGERLTVFDGNRRPIGTELRETVHRDGLWHETFQCWFITRDGGAVYVQQRSQGKKDYPGLFDITAAGHLLAGETAEDGVREIEEELGIEVSFQDLHPLGVIEDRIRTEAIDDNEFAHVFLYAVDAALPDFRLQEEEVAGICLVPLQDFAALWDGRCDTICTADEGRRLTRADFVPHTEAYYRTVIRGIQAYRQQRGEES